MPKFADPEEAYRAAREEILHVAKEGGHLLDLHECGLTALPPEIGQCRDLRAFILSDNQLTTLPPELAECARLQALGLTRNRFRRLPAVLRACHGLTQLELDGNDLRIFPGELLECRQFKFLSLCSTGLTELSREIGRLRELRILSLEGNRLTALPQSLRQLPNLEGLFLHGNEALGLPPEILGPTSRDVLDGKAHPTTPKSILDYYFSRRAGGEKALGEVRMIFAGRGGAGKTSLVNRLVFDRFRKDEVETPGIDITDWIMNDCPAGAQVVAHLWDLAGQVITHAMHQFFFSSRTVYVLVLTGRENAERDDADYWLRLIAAFGTERDETVSGPPVIVALNKWDDPGSARARLDRAALRERYPFIVGFVETDCATKRGLPELRAKLCETVGAMKWVRDGFPAKWAGVKDKLRANPDPHLGYDVFRGICRAEGVADEGEQDSLATALHALGAVHETWTDRCIQPGEDWDRTIKAGLESADVIVLLVSNAALASEYIQAIEMRRAIERHAAGEAVLVAVILEQCLWKKTPLAQWQVILPNRKPVLESRPQTNGWASVAEELHKLFERLRVEHEASRASGGK